MFLDGFTEHCGACSPASLSRSCANEEVVPTLRQNVFYIAAGVMLRPSSSREPCADDDDDDDDQPYEVLLVQEAKSSCRGKWYLPAGRVEAGESMIEAMSRELMEESGLDGEPLALLCLEAGSDQWYRFTFLLRESGGRLKTTEEADSESLQADWFPVADVLEKRVDLRATDMQKLVKTAMAYMQDSGHEFRESLEFLPKASSVACLSAKILITYSDESVVLASSSPTSNATYPWIHWSPNNGHIAWPILKLLKDSLDASLKSIVRIAIASVSTYPKDHKDGITLSLVITVRNPASGTHLIPKDGYIWHLPDDETIATIKRFREHGPELRLT